MRESTADIKRRCVELAQDDYVDGLKHTLIDRSFFRDFDLLKGIVAMELHKHGFCTRSFDGDLLVTKF